MCYNAQATIAHTIASIESQTHQDIEHIVIDGRSTDTTMDIVRASPSISRYISEPDQGIYDAMNKGLSLCSGDVIGILNADDEYAHHQVLEKVAAIFQDADVEACYADLVYVDARNSDKVIRYWHSGAFAKEKFKAGWMPAHPTFFARRQVYDRFGNFDLRYRLAADFELLFRMLAQHAVATRYLAEVIVRMRLGGATNKSLSNILRQNREIVSVLKAQHQDFSALRFAMTKLIDRVGQFIFRPK